MAFQQSYSQIDFIENKGQWDKRAQFMSAVGNGAFFLEEKGFTVLMHNSDDLRQFNDQQLHGFQMNNSSGKSVIHSHAYKVEFVNCNSSPEIILENPMPSVNNYFVGKDESKWAPNCRLYSKVTYKDIYPNIDVRYYSDAAGRMKYDFIVKPGGNPQQIALRYKGADKISIKNNELIIATSVGENKELFPYSYEVFGNRRKDVDCRFMVDRNTVKFKVNNHSSNNTLIIDPTLIFFSYSGSVADNWGFAATYGADGSFYSGGISYGGGLSSFPVSEGAFQTTFGGGKFDMAIMKLSANGNNRIYATYIGGNGSEQPHNMIVDQQGNLIIEGRTNSSNYPVKPASNIYGTGGGYDIVVSKLNAAGNALIGSMRIGGSGNDGVNIISEENEAGTNSLKRNYGDDARNDVLLDETGNIYIASSTQSSNFKTSPGVIQNSLRGGQHNQDGVIIKLNPNCTSVIWSTFLGGTGDDACYALSLGNSNNIYVAGGTVSTDLTGISSSGVINSFNSGGACDGFILELSTDGTTAIQGTYVGTSSADQVYEIQTDKNSNVYIMGVTEGVWPVINAAYVNANSKQFISKLQPDLSDYIYSTVFGSGSVYPNISPTAFFVDRCENVYVSGWGGKSNTLEGYGTGTTRGMPVTADAIKPVTDPSGSDFYFFVLKKDAASQLYGSFFGQEDPIGMIPATFGDHVDGGGKSRFDNNGILYQAMCANCNASVSYPGTTGSWSSTNNAVAGGRCNAGMLKIAMNFSGVAAAPKASDTLGCVSYPINFSDTLNLGTSYIWDFGDGSSSINSPTSNVTHTYSSIGRYVVRLIAINNSTCNGSDTGYLNITVKSDCPITLCPKGNTTLTSNITGTNYQWQLSTDSIVFNNISDDINYGGTTNSTLQLNSLPSSWYGYQYRCVVDGISSNIFTTRFSNLWTGVINSSWEEPANWSCGNVPDENTDVVITSGTIILNSSTTIRSLTLSAGVNFTVTPGFNLTITH